MKRLAAFSLLGASTLLLTTFGLALSEEGKENASVANLPTTPASKLPGSVVETQLENKDGNAKSFLSLCCLHFQQEK